MSLPRLPSKIAVFTPLFTAGVITLVVAALTIAQINPYLAQAQEAPVRFLDASMESNFPESITFRARFEADVEIEDVRVRFVTGPASTQQYDYLDIVEGEGGVLDGTLEWRVNTSARYVPPGAIVKYHFQAFGEDGTEYLSDAFEGIVTDSRYEWEVVTTGPIHVYYHGPVETRATRLAQAAETSMNLMAPITGSEIETPIIVTLYNNNAEMIGAVQARSSTITRELITEGQAFHEESVVLVLSGNRDIGTLTHELTHILVGRAAGGSSALVPLWLNEGLAEYGNLDKGLSYVYYLEWAIDTNRITPFSRLRTFPGEPELVLVSYGQSRSMVEYLIETYGGDKIAEVLAMNAGGSNSDIAFSTVYGKTVQQLDNDWRESVGADTYVPPTATPTPDPDAVPTPEFGLLTLTPTEGGITIGATPTPLPSPEPAPTATHTPVPTEPPPEPTEVIVDTPEPTNAPEATPAAPDEEASGGFCNAPSKGSPLEASTALILLGFAAFATFRISRGS